MRYPKCNSYTKVVDLTDLEDINEVKRKRQCEKYRYKFTTYEKFYITRFTVIKSF